MPTDLSPLTPAEQQGSTGAPAVTGGVDLSPLTSGERSAAPDTPWVTNWSHGGDINLPQSWQDFGNIMGERASSGFMLPAEVATGEAPDAATAKARLDAATQRLGPKLSTVADTLGYYASPTNLLNGLPVVGGALSGAANEGFKSYNEGDDASTIGKHIWQGALTGGTGGALSRLALMPQVISRAADLGMSGLGAAASHLVLGDTVVPGSSALAGYLTHNAVQPAVKWVENNAGRLAARVQNPLEKLLTGVGLAAPQTVQELWNGKQP